MGRRIDVDYLSPVVEQHNEAVQNVESHSRYDEKINGYNLILLDSRRDRARGIL
jgi:hypothetical protein